MIELLSSALIYIFTFSASLAIFWIGQKTCSNNKRVNILSKIILFIAVLLPSLLAGMRDNSVGIDVEVYIVRDMKTACSLQVQSLTDCFAALDRAPEYLYMLLVYICSRITADEGLLLFFIQFFTIGPLAMAAVKLRKEISIPLAMATYLFCFYNNTLNMMRQSISCAFILLGAVYYFNNKMKINIKTVICYVIACLFHNSGIMGVLIIYILCRISTFKLKRWGYGVIYATIIVFPVIITPLFEFLVSHGMTNDSATHYADIFLYRNIGTDWIIENIFSPGYIAETLGWLSRIIVPCYCLKSFSRYNEPKIMCIRNTAICGTMMYLVIQYAMRTIYGNRLSAFMDIFLVLLVPYAARGRNAKTKSIVLYAMVIVFWFLYVMLFKWSGETHIYTFRF